MSVMGPQRLIRLAEKSSLSAELGQAISKGDNCRTVNPRHLIRALLRQCTYLPDSSARHYFRNHVVAQFRRNNPRPPTQHDRNVRLEKTPVDKKRLGEARKALSFLERANKGHPPHLEKILAMAYGRRGKRRRKLISQLAQDIPSDKKGLSESTVSTPGRVQGPILGKKIEALVKSQRSQEASKPESLLLKPTIPEKNSWGRAMPLKRVRNMQKKWYARILDIIQPPLPEKEWERLRDLASGRVRWEGPVPRRKMASMNGHDVFGEGADREHENSPGISSMVDDFERSKLERARGVLTNPHELTPRFMRRIYSKIFAQCPTMVWDTVQSKWIVKWGTLHKMREKNLINLGPNDPNTSHLFEGVDEEGRIRPE